MLRDPITVMILDAILTVVWLRQVGGGWLKGAPLECPTAVELHVLLEIQVPNVRVLSVRNVEETSHNATELLTCSATILAPGGGTRRNLVSSSIETLIGK